MSFSVTEMLETIRDNASDMYIERVPVATLSNLTQVGDAITSSKNIMNEFVTALINKVAETHIKLLMFKNPLAKLKSNGVPFGSSIEEIYVNPAVDVGWSNEPNTLLTNTTPDGKTAYYGLNRQSKYPVSIREDQLKQAFRNEQSFNSFYNAIISSLYSGDNIDEFTLTKKSLGLMVDNSHICDIEVDITNPKEVAKTISNISDLMMFPNTEFCAYNKVNATAISGGATPCITYTPKENQVLLMTTTVKNEINYEYLANCFNMSLVDLQQMTILVDSFPSTKKDIYAILCDKESIQMRDVMYKTTQMYNDSNLTWNIWLHHWQYVYNSLFGNMVSFSKTKTA